MNRLHRSGRSLGTLAAVLLLGSSSTLPVLAAMPQRQPTEMENRLSGEAVPLLASSDSDSDSDKEKKKKKKKQQDQQRQPKQQPQSTPANKQEHKGKLQKDSDRKLNAPTKNSNKKSDTKTKAGSQKHSTGDNKQRPSKSKASDEQRQEIYQKGREDGVKKGREKGFDKGYNKGYEAGKKKGKDEAYHKARRQEWQSWNRDQWRSYNRSRRNIWVRPVTYNRPFYGYPTWAQNSNWGYNRPWDNGWYSSGNPSWSWWGGQALGWGINALTTALIVNNAINNAIRERQPTVVVPNSAMQLYYGSVEARDQTEVTFMVANGSDTYEMVADCEDGLLNGEVPTVVAEAELVNTACQVAFGST
jgi:outer membrane biosynthesis protein TonB